MKKDKRCESPVSCGKDYWIREINKNRSSADYLEYEVMRINKTNYTK